MLAEILVPAVSCGTCLFAGIWFGRRWDGRISLRLDQDTPLNFQCIFVGTPCPFCGDETLAAHLEQRANEIEVSRLIEELVYRARAEDCMATSRGWADAAERSRRVAVISEDADDTYAKMSVQWRDQADMWLQRADAIKRSRGQ